jgi:hypothetical protein
MSFVCFQSSYKLYKLNFKHYLYTIMIVLIFCLILQVKYNKIQRISCLFYIVRNIEKRVLRYQPITIHSQST